MHPTPRKKVSPAPLLRPSRSNEPRALTRASRATNTAYSAVMAAVGIALVIAPIGMMAGCATRDARPPGGIAPIDPMPLGGAAPPTQPQPVPSGSTSTTIDGQTGPNGQAPPCPHGPGNPTT